jgi:hypothetical protein
MLSSWKRDRIRYHNCS